MTTPPGSGPDARTRRLGLALAACRMTLAGLFAAITCYGVLFTPAAALAVAVPTLGVVTAGCVGGVVAWRTGHALPLSRLTLTGLLGGGLIPFGAGLGGLGTTAVPLLTAMFLGAGALLLHRETAGRRAVAGLVDRELLATAGVEDAVVTMIGAAPLNVLIAEWRITGRELASADADRGAAVAWYRSLLLEEMERRDPVGTQRWLAKGGVNDPERFLYDGRDVGV